MFHLCDIRRVTANHLPCPKLPSGKRALIKIGGYDRIRVPSKFSTQSADQNSAFCSRPTLSQLEDFGERNRKERGGIGSGEKWK